MGWFYYIGDNITSGYPQDLKPGVRIMRHKEHPLYHIEYQDLEGPFTSISQLKEESKIFKSLAKRDPARVQKILDKKNIPNCVKFIVTDLDHSFTWDQMQMFHHVIAGDVKSQKLSGGHLFDPTKMRVKKLLKKADINFVWEAVIEVYDKKQDKWYEKVSTLFPVHWSLTQLYHECDYATKNKTRSSSEQYIYDSLTLSNVPVKIIIKNNKLVSIYPLYTVP